MPGRKRWLRQVAIVASGIALLLAAGCSIAAIDIGAAKSEREITRELSVSSPNISTIAATTHNGALTLAGADTDQVRVKALVQARAATAERAAELAEQTELLMESKGEVLDIQPKIPERSPSEQVSVRLDITLPSAMAVRAKSHNGKIDVSDVRQLEGLTHNGGIAVRGIAESARVETHNGSVECAGVGGELRVTTHNGSIQVESLQESPVLHATTHNGGIELKTPGSISAKANLVTHNGSVHTDLPIAVLGKAEKNKIIGTIGSGKGTLDLQTHNGSIRVEQAAR